MLTIGAHDIAELVDRLEFLKGPSNLDERQKGCLKQAIDQLKDVLESPLNLSEQGEWEKVLDNEVECLADYSTREVREHLDAGYTLASKREMIRDFAGQGGDEDLGA